MAAPSSDATVLVVDDEQDVADAYAVQLQIDYNTQTAYGGEDALSKVDDSIDVVLLDRRMPNISGDEVLETIRARNIDCSVVMVTAVDPDFDIVDMSFNDYICKPVDNDELITAIETQITATKYGERLREYMNLSTKLELLKDEKSESALQGSDEMKQLAERVERLGSEVDEMVVSFEDSSKAFQDLV
ncbi:response regulator [Halovenus rubra]|uniref:Response regulator n=2 Tax=Halovenus rubra TaxID=869890 RepID=A0ACC7E381_9EURY|nr:response regulator [Halovenus rubra]